MSSRRLLSLLLLTACGDDFPPNVTATTSTGEPNTGDVLSAGQTSTPTDATGDPPDSTTTTTSTSTTGSTSTSTTDTSSSTASTTDSPIDCPDQIFLADPMLHTKVRAELGLAQGPIPVELAPALEHVESSISGVTSLAGLECFPNLKTLQLAGGTISDLGPLSNLKKLEFIQLPLHQIADLGPLAGLPSLRHLAIDANPVSDLSALATLPKLDTLIVSDCPLPSFDQLAGLPLVELWADRVFVPLDAIGDLEQLQVFHMEFAAVTDIGPLAGATALVTLAMRGNKIADLGALAGAANLEDLDLGSNVIVDLAPLAGLPALRRLSLNANLIVEPAPLAGLPALEILELASNPLKPDLGALLALGDLVELDLSDTDRAVLLPFAPQSLEVLAAKHNEIVDLGPLAGHTELRDLNLLSNAIVDLGPLAGHTELRGLVLADNAIVTIEPIVAAPFWNNPCVSVSVTGNPLGADTLDNHLPQLCQLMTRISWDQGSCDACPIP